MHTERQKAQNSQHNIEGLEQNWRTDATQLEDFLCCKNHDTVVPAEEQKTRSGDRIESPEIDAQKYRQLIFDKGAKVIQWSKLCLFNKWYWNNRTSTCKKN